MSLFGAAAAFHAAAPWEVAPPRTPLRVSYRIQLKPEVFARVVRAVALPRSFSRRCVSSHSREFARLFPFPARADAFHVPA